MYEIINGDESIELQRSDISRSFLKAADLLFESVPTEKLKYYKNGLISSQTNLAGNIKIEISKTFLEETPEGAEVSELITGAWEERMFRISKLENDNDEIPIWESSIYIIGSPVNNSEQVETRVLKATERYIDDRYESTFMKRRKLQINDSMQRDSFETARMDKKHLILISNTTENFNNITDLQLENKWMDTSQKANSSIPFDSMNSFHPREMDTIDHNFVLSVINYLIKDPPDWH